MNYAYKEKKFQVSSLD